jgi:hypothetical protein
VTYDAAKRSEKTSAECQAAVGKRATLTLTGTIVDTGEAGAGNWVKFEIDERWGFGDRALVMDLDPFEIQEEGT